MEKLVWFYRNIERYTDSNFASTPPLQWRHNVRDGISNQQPQDCLLNGLFRCIWKKTPKLHVTDGVIMKKGSVDIAFMLYKMDVIVTRYIAMMTSSNGYIFRVTGPLFGEFTGQRWIPLTKASDAELWCFLWSVPEQTVKQMIETPVIWDAIAVAMMSL